MVKSLNCRIGSRRAGIYSSNLNFDERYVWSVARSIDMGDRRRFWHRVFEFLTFREPPFGRARTLAGGSGLSRRCLLHRSVTPLQAQLLFLLNNRLFECCEQIVFPCDGIVNPHTPHPKINECRRLHLKHLRVRRPVALEPLLFRDLLSTHDTFSFAVIARLVFVTVVALH